MRHAGRSAGHRGGALRSAGRRRDDRARSGRLSAGSPSPGGSSPGGSSPGLYVHVPFCSAVCPYCDFAVTTGGETSRARYLDALLAEIDLWSAEPGPFADAEFDTIYLGGGTPTALSVDDLRRLLEAIHTRLPIASGTRLLIEANPEDVSPSAAAAWRDLGVSFLSLGVQSFDDEALRLLGRRHDGAESRNAVATALAAGIETVSLDLIYGWPGQTAEGWSRDLDTAARLTPQHISCYQLEVHAGTPFGAQRERGELAEAPEPLQAALFALTHERLGQAGFHAYEVSNFAAAPEHRSPHNPKYWTAAAYLGVGPSSHSFDGDRTRWWNERRLGPWRGRLGRGEKPIAGRETLSAEARALEVLMLGLRTAEGVDLANLSSALGHDLRASNGALIERFEADGLARIDGDRLVPSRSGLAVADGLAAAFALEQ